MADKEASFAVRLVDRVTRPSRAVAAALGRVTRAARRASAGRALGSRSSGAFQRLDASGQTKDEVKRQKRLSKYVDQASRSVGSLARSLAGATIKATLLGGAMAGIGAAFVVKGIAEATMFAERMRMAFTSLTGSVSAGEASFQRSISLSRELGLGVQDTAKQYAKLLAAQFKAPQAERLIALTTDLKAIGATAEETHSAIRAITQIKAKGRLQAEELVGQLAEAGVATTLVYEELAKAMNVDVKKVPGIITSGAVDADMGIAAIEAAILKKVGIKKAGEAGKRFANNTLAGMVARLKNAPENLFLRIAEAGNKALPKMKSLVEQLEQAISSISPTDMALAFERVIDLAKAGITLGIEFSRGFSEGFGEISHALQPGDIATASANFRELGRNVAKLTVLAIDAAKAVGSLFNWFNSDTGKTVLATGTIALGMFKLLGAVGAVGAAFGATAGTGLLATMGSFGVGAALVGKGLAGIGTLLVALKAGAVAFGSAMIAAIAPIAVPLIAATAAFTAAYVAAKKLFDLVGVTKWAEDVTSRWAGWTEPTTNKRGSGAIATQTPGHPYAAAGLTTRPSAIVSRDQLAPTAAAGRGEMKIGTVQLNVGAPPASMANRPREWGQKLAEGFQQGLADTGGLAHAPAGG
jgi:tape measure domain-containing protein